MTEAQATTWPEQPRAANNAPNILLILTDDVGFGATSTFGGPVPSPVFDQLAADGLRFTRFHTTAMCSPTRASLLTGRNPHNVNMGYIANYPTGVDGYTTVIPDTAGTIADVLKMNGYSTAMFGKSHLTPDWELSSVGPHDRWPTGLGFDYFYGFLAHDTNQWAPNLVENTRYIDPPQDGSHFDELMADRAISWISQQRATAPERPFFAYYAPGTAHTPHHAPASWLEQFRGQFNDGWDALRSRIFERQKELGVIPEDAKLTPRPVDLPAWETLSAVQRRLASRFMEAYAAALAHCDHQIGRVIQSIAELGERDNTLIIFIQGDNGGSAEGGLHGLFNGMARQNAFDEDPDYVLSRIDDIGGPAAHSHYPAGWAWATNTPFQYYKQVASHFGGTRNGLVIQWPRHIPEGGGIRTQFHHVCDVMPTILDAAGVAMPEEIAGIPQIPMDGVSMLYAFGDATSAERKTVQLFECKENFGIYQDGWFAGTRPGNVPYVHSMFQKPLAFPEDRQWELYHVQKDFSQAHDLADEHPEKLRELQATFWTLAGENKILPIHAPSQYLEGRPTLGRRRNTFTYYGPMHSRIYEDAAPNTVGKAFTITVDLVIPALGGRGVLLSHGGKFGGYALYFKDGHVIFHYNAIETHQYAIRTNAPLAPGAHQIVVAFSPDFRQAGSGGVITIDTGTASIVEGRVERTLRSFMNSEGFNIGRDSLTPVCDGYTIEDSAFNGRLKKVVVTLGQDG